MSRPRRLPPAGGFTIIEIIITLTLGLTLAAMLVVTTDRMYTHSPMGLFDLETQYGLLQEMEDLTGEYRGRIEAGTLDLPSMLAGWTTTDSDVTMSYQTVSVTDTGNAYTVGASVYKVTMTNGDCTVRAYFTQ